MTCDGGTPNVYSAVAGSYSHLGSATTPNPGVGDTVRLTMTGTTIKLLVNGGETFSTTDSAVASGGAGIAVWQSAAGGTGTWESWTSDTIPTGGGGGGGAAARVFGRMLRGVGA